MTTYHVTAWCQVSYYATFDLDAKNIDEALKQAKLRARDECGEPCGGEYPWDEFEITSENAAEHVRHFEPSWLAAIAADELLDTLQRGVALAESVVDSWDGGDLAGALRALSQWLAGARAAIAKATKQ